jgi:hypothetical protein
MNLLFWAFSLWLLTISEKCLSSSSDSLLGEGDGPMVHTGAVAGAGVGSSNPRPCRMEDFVKSLVEKAKGAFDVGAWKAKVAPLLGDPVRFKAVVKNEKLKPIVLAISRLLRYKEDPDSIVKTVVDYDAGIDQAALDRAYLQYFSATPPRIPVETRIKNYLDSGSTLNLLLENDDIKAALREALLEHVRQNGGEWPGPESLKKAEQFFWNLCRGSDLIHVQVRLIKIVFGTSIKGDWNDFIEFCRPYMIGDHGAPENIFTYCDLLPVYQAFSTLEEREAFLEFCKPYYWQYSDKSTTLKELLPVYQAFSTPEEREAFLRFCKPYYWQYSDTSTTLKNLLPVYQAFSTPAERKAFLRFWKPYHSEYSDTSTTLKNLLPVYQAFSTPAERKAFLRFCKPYHSSMSRKSTVLANLLPVYQAFPGAEERAAFLRFCKPYIPQSIDKNYFMRELLPLYQSFGIDGSEAASSQRKVAFDEFFALSRGLGFREDLIHILVSIYLELKKSGNIDNFKKFCTVCESVRPTRANINEIFQIYKSGKKNDFLAFMNGLRIRDGQAVWSYVYRTYLRYMRVNAALEAEGLSLNESGRLVAGTVRPSRLHAMRETKINHQLPVYYVGEPLSMHAGQGTANAHDFEAVYELDQGLFSGSKLRPLIAADDLPPVTSDDDIKARIASAPFRAQQLFNRMKREDSGVIRALIERKMIEGGNPELWERYQAYYDTLYRRKRNEDGSFQKDENILTRNDHGDLVSLYDGDGNLRPEPIIVYYQAEFQVFEQAFTELMRKQFEEQRGLIY